MILRLEWLLTCAQTKALWKYYDDSVDSKFILQRQVMHVSTLSICSCIGRLLSGQFTLFIPSDDYVFFSDHLQVSVPIYW